MVRQPMFVAPRSIGNRHLSDSQLEWIDFDPSPLVEMAKSADDVPADLAERLALCTRAAWECAAYIRFRARTAAQRHGGTVILETEHEDFAVDLDDEGKPVGVELVTVASLSH